LQAVVDAIRQQDTKQAAARERLQQQVAGAGQELQRLQAQQAQQDEASRQQQAQLAVKEGERQQLEQQLERLQQAYIDQTVRGPSPGLGLVNCQQPCAC
jgi:hypothetical protein